MKKWIITLIFLLFCSFAYGEDYSNEYVLVFSANWCLPCKRMERLVWPKEDIVDILTRFRGGTANHIDVDKYPQVADKWKIYSVPTIIIYNGKTGKELRRSRGEQTHKQLREFLLGSKKLTSTTHTVEVIYGDEQDIPAKR